MLSLDERPSKKRKRKRDHETAAVKESVGPRQEGEGGKKLPRSCRIRKTVNSSLSWAAGKGGENDFL